MHAGALPAPEGFGGHIEAALDRSRGAIAAGIILLANVLTKAGVAILTNRLVQSGTAPKYIGWGIGTYAADSDDIALESEAAPTTAGGRTTGTESRTTVTHTNDTLQVAGTVTAVSTLDITESGLFDALTAGNLFVRCVFAAIGVESNDSIAFTFRVVFSPTAS